MQFWYTNFNTVSDGIDRVCALYSATHERDVNAVTNIVLKQGISLLSGSETVKQKQVGTLPLVNSVTLENRPVSSTVRGNSL